jgi:hypothetical protein
MPTVDLKFWVVSVVGLAVAITICWWTVYRQKEEWWLAALRTGSFLGAIILRWLQVAYQWQTSTLFWACVIVFVLAIFSRQSRQEGGETVDSDSGSQ